jgi:DNA-binding transcriptional LysR family regulator
VLRFPSPQHRIRMLPVKLPLRRMPIGIITVKGRTLSPTAQLFIDAAREVAKPLAARKA